ncbi:MAG TPA: hypothetical protein VGO62_11930 [Myxococcota bacterium]|jgi:hypothetical protein
MTDLARATLLAIALAASSLACTPAAAPTPARPANVPHGALWAGTGVAVDAGAWVRCRKESAPSASDYLCTIFHVDGSPWSHATYRVGRDHDGSFVVDAHAPDWTGIKSFDGTRVHFSDGLLLAPAAPGTAGAAGDGSIKKDDPRAVFGE